MALFTKLPPGLEHELSEIRIKADGWIRKARVLTGGFVMFAIRLTLTIVEGWQAPFNVRKLGERFYSA